MLRYAAYIVIAIASIELGSHLDFSLILLGYIILAFLLGVFTLLGRIAFVRQIFILIVLSLVLIARVNQAAIPITFNPHSLNGETVKLEAIVSEEPRRTQGSLHIVLGEVRLTGEFNERWYGKMIISLPTYSEVEYGDLLKVEGEFEDITHIEDEGYRNYLYHHLIFGEVKWPTVSIIGENKGNKLIAMGLSVQHKVNNELNRILPQDEAAFLSGVVLGSRQLTTEQFSDALKITGTNHLIVASGYNISILIALVLKTKKLLSKHYALLLVLIMIACYTLISGLDPSIIRASIMASLGLLAIALGRQKQAIYLTLLAGYIMLAIKPSWVYDIGFQLSFAATFGIITLQPYFFSKLFKLPNLFREILSTTIAAQIFVYPILIVSFGQISLISLITNMLIIWVIPILMFSGIIIALLTFIMPVLAKLSAALIFPMLWYIKSCILLTSKIPYAIISIQNFGWMAAAIYYALIYYLYKIRSVYETNT